VVRIEDFTYDAAQDCFEKMVDIAVMTYGERDPAMLNTQFTQLWNWLSEQRDAILDFCVGGLVDLKNTRGVGCAREDRRRQPHNFAAGLTATIRPVSCG
jgi:hypothetical protein